MRSGLFAAAIAGALVNLAIAQSTQPSMTNPVRMTSEQDHQRLLGLLHITNLRSGVDGMNPNAPNAVNYDEAKAGPTSPLPDPLVMNDGTKVTTSQQWRDERRPQIVELFDREVYGRAPVQTPTVKWEVLSTTKSKDGDIPTVVKQLVGHVDHTIDPAITVDILATLTTPADATGPVPALMEFSFTFPPRPANGQRRAGTTQPSTRPRMMFRETGPTGQHQILAKGWAWVSIQTYTIQPDNGAGLTQGIIGLCNQGQPRKVDDWGALRAWGWGASRVLDYLQTDPAIDAKKVAIEGHSRFGKAALVAMAYDPRIAVGFISSSGEGGAKLHRRNFGELVENVASSGEYHWMAGNFLKYAGPLTANDLPVDSHELIALCAPRPVFISAGTRQAGDGWVDAKGSFLAAVGASPVYELLGKKGLTTTEFPPVETTLIDGDIGFRQHTAGHTPTPNWPTFITFASRYLVPDAGK